MNTALLDRSEIRQVLFHPRGDDSYHGPRTHLVHVEVEPGVLVGGRLYPARAESPLLLYYHGNGEIAADYDYFADMYNRLDITLLVMDYRGYGTSGGAPTAATLVSDAVAIFQAIDGVFTEHGLIPSRVYVMGRSLGSVPAVETALRAGASLSGLIIESGFSDTFGLLARMGVRMRDVEEERDGFGNAFKMEQVTVPTLLLHGQQDFLIPPSDGETLHQHCAAEKKELVLIPGAGHNDIMITGMSVYFEAIRKFIVEMNGK